MATATDSSGFARVPYCVANAGRANRAVFAVGLRARASTVSYSNNDCGNPGGVDGEDAVLTHGGGNDCVTPMAAA
eukprot:8278374-Lingulodinium_polyedra.AAC.1